MKKAILMRCVVFSCAAMIVANSMANVTNYQDLVRGALNVMRNCFFSDVKDYTLLLAGEYTEMLLDNRNFFEETTVALLSNSKRNGFHEYLNSKNSFLLYKEQDFIRILCKLHRFIVIASSPSILRSTLQTIKDSTWENSEGTYLLIDRHSTERGCENAYSYLWIAWNYDLLHSLFLCVDPIEGIMIYTYSPYSDIVPTKWREIEQFKGRNDHPWILLTRKYEPGLLVCDDLKFDKTAALNGYQIKLNAVAVPPLLTVDATKNGLDMFDGEDSKIMKTVLRKLNATVDVTVVNGNLHSLGAIKINGSLYGMLKDVSDGFFDMGMNSRLLFNLWKIRYTYPHAEGGLCSMSQIIDEVSELEKLLTFLSTPLLIGMFIVCMITYVILARHEGLIKAGLNIVRLIVCGSIIHPPTVTSARIFLCSTFIIVLTVNAVFQSHWYALLTVSVDRPNIDTFDDLERSKFDLYGSNTIKEMLSDSRLQSRFHVVSYSECTDFVKNTTNVACISDCMHLLHRITETYLYRSRQMIREFSYTFVTRENWPLYDKVNNELHRLVEAGLVSLWRLQGVDKISRLWIRFLARRRDYKPLNLNRLSFSFYILGAGCSCAIIVFLIELIVGKRQAKTHNSLETTSLRSSSSSKDKSSIARTKKLFERK